MNTSKFDTRYHNTSSFSVNIGETLNILYATILEHTPYDTIIKIIEHEHELLAYYHFIILNNLREYFKVSKC